VAAAVAASLPMAAVAYTPPKTPSRPTYVAPKPEPTVDHPLVDGVGSFDNGSRAQNKVALTFDADMTPGMLSQLRAGQVRSWYNQELRDLLDAEHIRATIFLTGLWTETYPDVARSLAHDPNFELGDHTYDHAAFRTPCYGLPGAADRTGEITHAQDTIAAITGVRPNMLRFPGDCYDRSDQALAQQQGLVVISGDVRSGDAFNNNATSVATTVLSQLKPGSIVVMHFHGAPNAPMTAPAVRMIIQGARARGLEFGTVSEVLGRAPAAPTPPDPAKVLATMRDQPLAPPGVPQQEAMLAPFRAHPLAPPRPLAMRSWESLLA
jgi:peptidoglycan-N-acetylglucosamine deacetylase